MGVVSVVVIARSGAGDKNHVEACGYILIGKLGVVEWF